MKKSKIVIEVSKINKCADKKFVWDTIEKIYDALFHMEFQDFGMNHSYATERIEFFCDYEECKFYLEIVKFYLKILEETEQNIKTSFTKTEELLY